MNGRVAKRIKRGVYGRENSPRARRYKADVRREDGVEKESPKRIKSVTIFDAGLRRSYQRSKKEYKRRMKMRMVS